MAMITQELYDEALYYLYNPWGMLPLFAKRDLLINVIESTPVEMAGSLYRELYETEEALGWRV